MKALKLRSELELKLEDRPQKSVKYYLQRGYRYPPIPMITSYRNQIEIHDLVIGLPRKNSGKRWISEKRK